MSLQLNGTVKILLLEVSNILSSSCITWTQIKCCCTDSPSTMIKFCCLLNERHKHIIFLPCALHALNLLAKDLSKFEDAVPIVRSNCMIVNFFYLVTCLATQLQGMGREKGTNGKSKNSLDSLCETHWYSITKVCFNEDVYECLFFQSKENVGTDENHHNI